MLVKIFFPCLLSGCFVGVLREGELTAQVPDITLTPAPPAGDESTRGHCGQTEGGWGSLPLPLLPGRVQPRESTLSSGSRNWERG